LVLEKAASSPPILNRHRTGTALAAVLMRTQGGAFSVECEVVCVSGSLKRPDTVLKEPGPALNGHVSNGHMVDWYY